MPVFNMSRKIAIRKICSSTRLNAADENCSARALFDSLDSVVTASTRTTSFSRLAGTIEAEYVLEYCI